MSTRVTVGRLGPSIATPADERRPESEGRRPAAGSLAAREFAGRSVHAWAATVRASNTASEAGVAGGVAAGLAHFTPGLELDAADTRPQV